MTLMEREIYEQPEALERCRVKNEAAIRELAGEIRRFRPQAVVFAGRGSSDHAGQYGRYLTEIYAGVPVSLATPSVLTAYGGKVDYGKCLVIGISQSGRTNDVCEVLKAAGAQGALTVSITNDPASPVAGAARRHLSCEAGPELSVEATKTFATQMYLTYLLAAEWSGAPALLNRAEAVPGLVADALRLEAPLSALVPRYRFARRLFVLARGTVEPVAMEGCLKINESSYIDARPFSIIDFLHGPVAMLEKDAPVLLIDADRATRADARTIQQKCRRTGSDLLAFTADPELAKACDASLLLPEGTDGPEAAFTVMTLLQLFACKLALLKGYDPDHPRGLNKVTG